MMASMECHCLPLRDIPRTTKLFATYLDDFRRLKSFYSRAPDEAGVLAAARQVNMDPAMRRGVVEVLREQNRRFGAGPETNRNLDQLAAGAVAIVTGQQVGLFSGPAYSFYKALTAVHWARHLTERGANAVPVFWLATEDHDLAEVNHCFWMGREGLSRLDLPEEESASGKRVGEIALGAPVEKLVEAALETLEGASYELVAQALRESYRPEETFGSAFGKLMASLLANRGIIFLDPLDPRFHRLAAPAYRRAAEQAEELTRALIARNKELESGGFHAQVKITQQSTLLFANVNGHRLPLRRKNGGFLAGDQKFTPSELYAAIENSPERFTPNVLLRPIIQDTLLPTAGYVSGPAETAYFAQAEVLYKRLGQPMPPILPRASFTLIAPHVARLLKKYDLAPQDVIRGRQHLRSQLERHSLPKRLARRFDKDEKALRRLVSGLAKQLGKLDKTLLGALDTAQKRMLYQFLKLRAKAGRAENFRTGILDKHERILLESILPHHALQERSLCLLPFLATHGLELLDALEKRASPGATQHQLVFL
jgi:bacillithiol biosynthesis cysteine-adding enzyme BshC